MGFGFRLPLVAGRHDQQFIAKRFQAPAQAFNGNGYPADEGQVVVGKHGHPHRFVQPGRGVQVVVRVIILADENGAVQLDRNGRKHGDDQNKVEVTGVEQGVDKEPETFQPLQNRVLAHFQSLQTVCYLAI